MPVTPNQSYLVKQMQNRLASCLSSLIHELNGNTITRAHIWRSPETTLWYPTDWRIKRQRFTFRRDAGQKQHQFPGVHFSNARWVPGATKTRYGAEQEAQNLQVDDDEASKIILAGTDLHVSYVQEVSLTNSFSSTVSKGMTLDMTQSSTTTISGEYPGVKAEESLTLSFGEQETEEESKEEGKEGTDKEGLTIDFDATAGIHYLIKVGKEHHTTYQDFDIRGIMDFDVHIDMGEHAGGELHRYYPGDTVTLKGGFDGFEQFVRGYDTNYPKMQGFWEQCRGRTKQEIGWFLDTKHRALGVSGTNQIDLEDNADYTVKPLGVIRPRSSARSACS